VNQNHGRELPQRFNFQGRTLVPFVQTHQVAGCCPPEHPACSLFRLVKFVLVLRSFPYSHLLIIRQSPFSSVFSSGLVAVISRFVLNWQRPRKGLSSYQLPLRIGPHLPWRTLHACGKALPTLVVPCRLAERKARGRDLILRRIAPPPLPLRYGMPVLKMVCCLSSFA